MSGVVGVSGVASLGLGQLLPGPEELQPHQGQLHLLVLQPAVEVGQVLGVQRLARARVPGGGL